MSGPVDRADAPPTAVEADVAAVPTLEITPSREAAVGTMTVRRALPRRQRRTVGAWCFVDHMGPVTVSQQHPVQIGPHPHIGLHTVTWLLSGEMVHRDSLGSEQVIRPGQLNLMTAGNGIAHSEQMTKQYAGSMHGVQLWVAQPEETRFGKSGFEHHADLPQAELRGAVATVIVGAFADVTSPARTDTAMVGVELEMREGDSTIPLQPDFEYAVVVVDGAVQIEEQTAAPGALAYLGVGREELTLSAAEPTRLLLLGGEPFGEPVFMWWNFVTRTREEVEAARLAWESVDERFTDVDWTLPRIPAPELPWVSRR